MPSIARCFKVARLAVQHLGPPLVRGIFDLASGVIATLAANARRPLTWEEEEYYESLSCRRHR